jgi:hypothetical protein
MHINTLLIIANIAHTLAQTHKLFEKLRIKLFEYLFEKNVSII